MRLQYLIFFFFFFYVIQNPGVTQDQLTEVFPVESLKYGRQQVITAAVADLRKWGWLVDTERCECCHRALTRGRKHGPLYVTEWARKEVVRLTE